MDVELQYFDACPNWTIAEERLREALRLTGNEDEPIVPHRVETAGDAEAASFRGSPTFLIDGTDPFATGDALPEGGAD